MSLNLFQTNEFLKKREKWRKRNRIFFPFFRFPFELSCLFIVLIVFPFSISFSLHYRSSEGRPSFPVLFLFVFLLPFLMLDCICWYALTTLLKLHVHTYFLFLLFYFDYYFYYLIVFLIRLLKAVVDEQHNLWYKKWITKKKDRRKKSFFLEKKRKVTKEKEKRKFERKETKRKEERQARRKTKKKERKNDS